MVDENDARVSDLYATSPPTLKLTATVAAGAMSFAHAATDARAVARHTCGASAATSAAAAAAAASTG